MKLYLPSTLIFSQFLVISIGFSDRKELGANDGSCSLRVGECSYRISIDKDDHSCNYATNHLYGLLRKRRSTVVPSNNVATELHKLKRKVARLERRLTRSMEELTTRMMRGVRKIDQHLDLLGNHQKRDLSPRTSKSLCPQRFSTIYNGDSCYLLSNFNATWYEAKDYCTALNSDLVALGSIREHNLVSFLIKNNQAHTTREGWWTGGTFLAKNNQWMWVSETTLRPFTFIKWSPGQPNNTMTQCVYLDRASQHMWHDDNCNVKYNFVCETMAERV